MHSIKEVHLRSARVASMPLRTNFSQQANFSQGVTAAKHNGLTVENSSTICKFLGVSGMNLTYGNGRKNIPRNGRIDHSTNANRFIRP